MHADRRLHHQRLGRNVQAVAGVGLDHIDAVEMRRRAAAGDQKLRRHIAPPIGALAAEMHDDDLAAGIRRHAIRRRLAQRTEDAPW